MAEAKKKIGVCERGRELLRQGKTNMQVLTVLKKEFKKSKISMGSVGWLRNDLRSKGEKVKTNREITTATATTTPTPKKKTAKKAA
jgi:hypothetical protein